VLDGQVQEKPLLDLPVANSIERGLLGIAVSRHLKGKTFVFLSYTESENNEDRSDTDSQIEPLGNRLCRYEYVNGQLINPL